MADHQVLLNGRPEPATPKQWVFLWKLRPAGVEFLKVLDSCAPDLFRHTEATDQFGVGDKQLVALARKCSWCRLGHGREAFMRLVRSGQGGMASVHRIRF